MNKRFIVALLAFLPLPASIVAVEAAAGGLHVETGMLAGGAIGVESTAFSSWRAIFEPGYVVEFPLPDGAARWGVGATFYGALGGEDMRLGFKPRVRYRFDPAWSLDLSAGLIFATFENEPSVSDTGFAGGLHLNNGRWVTLRADVNVKRVSDREIFRAGETITVEGGHEVAVYGGLALRGGAGWKAAAIGGAVFLGLMLFVAASGGAS